MEALGEEAGWKREDEGGTSDGIAWNGGERGKIWRRRKEWKIGRRKGASLLKAAQKRSEI